ncbi:hypothetical protein SNK05_011769 [Fusarium graminearum]|uniref:Chromosome 3, complete genome n=1 Tax=Gibberella zeae (strain ATCC MYA-4620 / CBS 123657 / FGSC 9075 / NRRL 31084 / PH-1) TaxID=229533 RepID=A0A098DX77_GIBZE|nr:unnamed protein product [Fusarium graminearum]CEF85944.1 unnamed protein product [Fusarium graminearum]
MATNQNSPYVTTREQAVVEAWSQGFNIGAVVILILLVLCNYRRKTLLHKLILGELLLALGHGFFAFFEEPEYGWILSSTATLLYISYFIHNLIAWLKIRPFLPKWGARSFIITLLMVQPYWILETWANFQYHNHLGSRIFDTSRLLEPLFRDPWWVFTTIKLVLAIRENYEFTISGLVRTSPRFGIMLLCLFLSIVFLITDVIFMIVVSKRGGINPFWRLALVFKCASDVIFLDDFKSVLDRISESAMRKITTFEYRDNALPSVHLPASTEFSMPTYNRKSSRFESSSRAELGSILHPMASRDDGHYEYATNASQTFVNGLLREEHVQNPSSRSPRHRGESQDTMITRVDGEQQGGSRDIPMEPVKAWTREDQFQ